MIVFYFDTSALVKRYRKEAGSEVLDRVFKLEKPFATCFWTVLEFIVAFSARRRRGELSGETFNALVSRFLKEILDRFIVLSVDDEIAA
ncbi:MAG: type II toxin-antitoxin system VapC family toxin [Candidatus Brockarchaeota archaeon]|nr:type II toxin-antitoxin system VapC family toxin [Candidatus Brockarchaeota archaeon]MBO3810066.1 type II toxin-antitoxin system VapC family toxin [Candidatus Brockarchaeota archaeon]